MNVVSWRDHQAFALFSAGLCDGGWWHPRLARVAWSYFA